jgi:endonuclease/exonuclease/phosphatase family metal-dependent hydrolase
MKSFRNLVLFAALAAGGWYFFQHYRIEGWDDLVVRPKTAPSTAGRTDHGPPVARSGSVIRIASYNIQVFGEKKLGDPAVSKILADIVRRFDVVAIQEIRTQNDQFLRQFCELLNATGRHYDFVVGPRQGRTSSKEQYAFVFDTASIEVDRSKVYTVPIDPPLVHRPPLVAQFRVRGPPAEQAFTFKLVNIHTDPDDTEVEINTLDDVYRAVRDDGMGEDDVILLGDLNVDEKHFGELGQVPRITWLVSGLPTNTRGTKTYDNILFQRHATVEFTGRAGVFDVMREFNLASIDEAAKLSDHLPIWAEFALYENGQAQIASREKEAGAR